MATKRPSDDRDSVKATYAEYDQQGRGRLWDRTNPGFDRLKSDSERALLALLRSSVDGSGDRVLDVGCGNGDLGVLARRNGIAAAWTGVDLLPERIEVAQGRLPEATFLVASADDLPLEDVSFDVVAAITLFSSIPSDAMEDGVAREIARVLRPGGWLVWYDLRYDNPANPSVHGVTTARLRRLFPGWRQELRSLTVAPPIARRLGRSTPVAYPMLHALAPLRSHLVGRLLAPPTS